MGKGRGCLQGDSCLWSLVLGISRSPHTVHQQLLVLRCKICPLVLSRCRYKEGFEDAAMIMGLKVRIQHSGGMIESKAWRIVL